MKFVWMLSCVLVILLELHIDANCKSSHDTKAGAGGRSSKGRFEKKSKTTTTTTTTAITPTNEAATTMTTTLETSYETTELAISTIDTSTSSQDTMTTTGDKTTKTTTTTTNITTDTSTAYPAENATSTGTTDITSTTIENETNDEENNNCTDPYIKQFPKDLMTNKQRRHGGVVIHLLGAVISFIAVSMIVEQYFIPAIECFCDTLKMDEDIMGATIMAAGSSAPEVFISVIGSFLSNADVSIGTVVGSAVFNILFVIGICAVLTPTVVKLPWWPFFRDSIFYGFCLIVLVLCLMDGKIHWYESVVLICLYIMYILLLSFNQKLHQLAARLIGHSALETHFLLDNEGNQFMDYQQLDGDNDPITMSAASSTLNIEEVSPVIGQNQIMASKSTNLLNYLKIPLNTLFMFTIPDCRQHRWRRLFPLTFILAIAWLGFWCYILVWMVAVIGYTVGIPDSVMGITFVAAGTSLPDALASIYAVKSGHASMGVSNTIGSNVFDVSIALAVPWLIRSTVTGKYIGVNSHGLPVNTTLLIGAVLIAICCIKYKQFYLDRPLGLLLLCCYMCYLVLSLMIELNVFGHVNSIPCTLVGR